MFGSSCSTCSLQLLISLIFLIVVFFFLYIYIYIFFGMFHKCNVRDCASSAKSVVNKFGDRSDVLEKTMKITVPSLPKENGVPVKTNVILLRFPQANLFLAKIIVLDSTGVCFDAIVPPDRVTSEKAETSVTESPENKGIRVEWYSHKYSVVAKIQHYLRYTSWLQNSTC